RRGHRPCLEIESPVGRERFVGRRARTNVAPLMRRFDVIAAIRSTPGCRTNQFGSVPRCTELPSLPRCGLLRPDQRFGLAAGKRQFHELLPRWPARFVVRDRRPVLDQSLGLLHGEIEPLSRLSFLSQAVVGHRLKITYLNARLPTVKPRVPVAFLNPRKSF